MRHLRQTEGAVGRALQQTTDPYVHEAGTALLAAAARWDAAADDDPAALPALTADVLRLLGEMVGPAWLAGHVHDPGIGPATRVAESLGHAPLVPGDLDALLARVVRTRFPARDRRPG